MGLDAVELVMEVEDAFGVSIPNESAATIRTAGDLHRAVLDLRRRHPHDGATRCPSAVAFYKTRAVLMAALGVERKSIKPETPLKEVFPEKGRRERYKAWEQSMGEWYAPKLKFPRWFISSAPTISLGLGFVVWLFLFIDWGMKLRAGFMALLIAGAVLIGTALPAFLFAEWLGLRRHFPATCRTVGDLSQAVLLVNPGLAAPGPAMTDDFAWRMLVPIISEQLGIPEDQIHPHSRFVEDLHAD